jgi:hypothetical protein
MKRVSERICMIFGGGGKVGIESGEEDWRGNVSGRAGKATGEAEDPPLPVAPGGEGIQRVVEERNRHDPWMGI